MKIVVLAGGSGSRLWPISSEFLPKQFLKFFDKESLFQKTIKRFENFDLSSDLIIMTNRKYEKIVKDQVEEIKFSKKVHILIEPYKRNTASAIFLSIKYIKEVLSAKDDEKVLVLPSDHLISPIEAFLNYLKKLEKTLSRKIFIFGIRPNKPEIGYGYIEAGSKIEDDLYHVKNFLEKPNIKKAKEFLLSGNYFWNAGIFLFDIETYLKEITEHAQDICKFWQISYDELVNRFEDLPNISIDYSLIEKSKNVIVKKMDLTWSDVGSWDSIYDVLDKDENFNVKKGNIVSVDTKNSLIIGNKKLVSTIGIRDIIFIETDDAIYLAKKGSSQKLKELIEKNKEKIFK